MLTQEEKDFICKLIYSRYMTATDDNTIERCESILRKLGCRFPGFK